MIRTWLPALLATALATLPAQTVDVVGGTSSAPSRTNTSKCSLYRVDTTVIVIEFEVYLDVPGPETLTFFSYRHHSRTGTATLDWVYPVQVAGGIGPSWYSTGPIVLPLIGGNHYTLGVSWPGTLTYYYSTGATNSPVSFGSWQRAHTVSNPLPATLNLPSGVDIAQYHQRITTIPTTAVTTVGTSCGGSTLLPRLVANGMFTVGSTRSLELVDASPTALGVFSIALGPTLPVPFPMFGCSIWINIGSGSATLATITSAAGYASLPFAVPNVPSLVGRQFSAQAGVLSTGVDVTNAVDFTIS
jgi:hypothetical protein